MDAATTVHPTDQKLLAYRSGKLVDEVAELVSGFPLTQTILIL
jgi:hypothetical protein